MEKEIMMLRKKINAKDRINSQLRRSNVSLRNEIFETENHLLEVVKERDVYKYALFKIVEAHLHDS